MLSFVKQCVSYLLFFFLVLGVVWTYNTIYTHTNKLIEYICPHCWRSYKSANFSPDLYERISVRIILRDRISVLFFKLIPSSFHFFSVISFNRLFICDMLFEKEKKHTVCQFKGSKFERTKRILLLYLWRHTVKWPNVNNAVWNDDDDDDDDEEYEEEFIWPFEWQHIGETI